MPKVGLKPAPQRSVFLSYCHADYHDAVECVEWLRPMCGGQCHIWVDSLALKAGDKWEPKILQAIDAADVFVVLMSIKYRASDFCMNEEFGRILVKHRRGQAIVIGVALRDVVLTDFAGLDELQCLPQGEIKKDGASRLGLKPLSKWRDRSSGWFAVRTQIEAKLIDAASAAGRSTQPVPAAPPAASPIVAGLPFLCDRGEQQDLLHERLGDWSLDGSRRPLLVVTEGRVIDSPQEWVNRMHGCEIAAVLDFFREQGISFGEARVFAWPDAAADAEKAAKRLNSAFARMLDLNPLASPQAIRETHAHRGLPALWFAECTDDPASDAALRTLDALLQWLADWPDLEPRSMLVVALTVVRDAASAGGTRAWLGAAFDERLRAADAAGRVACAALGSLPEIDDPDITTWAMDKRVRPLLTADRLSKLRQQLPAPRIWPMQTFAEEAANWLIAT